MDTEVKTYMSGQPVTIEPDASALAALDLMIEHGIRHLPVVDPGRRVCGVLTIDDLRGALPVPVGLRTPPSVEDRTSLPDFAVAEVMTHAPVTIHYDTPLEEAAKRMAEWRIGCLPVVDEDGRLDGIVTETDLLHALATLLWSLRRGGPALERPGFGEALEKERSHLARQLAAYGRHEQEITEARRDQPQDFGDASSSAEEGWLTERLADLASRRLRGIEQALEREKRGVLRSCERCGRTIPEARLRALPGTTLCIRCARETEAPR